MAGYKRSNASSSSTSSKDGSRSSKDGSLKGKRKEDPDHSARSSVTASLRSSIQSKIDYMNMPPVYKIPVWNLNCQFDIVRKRHDEPTLLKDAIRHERKHQQANITIVFCIRQAGCASCREHGQQLAQLAANDRKLALMAICKETGINDRGLLEFYKEFFDRHPIYWDEKWALYHAMGGRKISTFKLFQRLIRAAPRYMKKKIYHSKGNFNPDIQSHWMTGGVLVFNKRGELTYVLEENVGKPFDMDRLEMAIELARSNNHTVVHPMDLSEISQSDFSGDDSFSHLRRSSGGGPVMPTIEDIDNVNDSEL